MRTSMSTRLVAVVCCLAAAAVSAQQARFVSIPDMVLVIEAPMAASDVLAVSDVLSDILSTIIAAPGGLVGAPLLGAVVDGAAGSQQVTLSFCLGFDSEASADAFRIDWNGDQAAYQAAFIAEWGTGRETGFRLTSVTQIGVASSSANSCFAAPVCTETGDAETLRTIGEPVLDVVKSGFLPGQPNKFRLVVHNPKRLTLKTSNLLEHFTAYTGPGRVERDNARERWEAPVDPSPGLANSLEVDGHSSACFVQYSIVIESFTDFTANAETASREVTVGQQDYVEVVGQLRIGNTEMVESVARPGQFVPRDIATDLVFIIRFPKSTSVTWGNIRVHKPPLIDPILVFQEVDVTVAQGVLDVTAKLRLQTTVQAPFRLCAGSGAAADPFAPDAGSAHCNGNNLVFTAPAAIIGATTPTVKIVGDCEEQAVVEGQPKLCNQVFEFEFTPSPYGFSNPAVCELDSDQYHFATHVTCYSDDGCTLLTGHDTTFSVDFELDSENFCPQVVDTVELEATLATYKDSAQAISSISFLEGQLLWAVGSVEFSGQVKGFITGADLNSITINDGTGDAVAYSTVPGDATGASQGAFAGFLTAYASSVTLPAASTPLSASQVAFSLQIDPTLFNIPVDDFKALSFTAVIDVQFAGVSLLDEEGADGVVRQVRLLGDLQHDPVTAVQPFYVGPTKDVAEAPESAATAVSITSVAAMLVLAAFF